MEEMSLAKGTAVTDRRYRRVAAASRESAAILFALFVFSRGHYSVVHSIPIFPFRVFRVFRGSTPLLRPWLRFPVFVSFVCFVVKFPGGRGTTFQDVPDCCRRC